MRSARLGALFVFLLAVSLSGCSGLDPPADTTSDLPPGVTQAGVEDPDALVEAHVDRLRPVSYGVSDRFESRSATGRREVSIRREIEFGHDPSRYSMRAETVTVVEGDDLDRRTVERWSNGTAVASRRSTGDRVFYEGTADAVGLFYPEPTPTAYTQGLYALLSTGNVSVVAATGEDELLLGGPIPNDSAAVVRSVDRTGASRGARFANASVELIVTDRGLVTWWRVTWTEIGPDGRQVRESRTVRLRDIGTATVDRPAWVRKALSNETAPTEVPGPIGDYVDGEQPARRPPGW